MIPRKDTSHLNNLDVWAAVPNLWGGLTVPSERQDIVSRFKICRNLDLVHQRPVKAWLARLGHILTSPMQTWSTWREFPALGTGWVKPAHGCRVAHRNRVHRPLRAGGERSLPCSVRTELDSGADVPAVLHPAVLRGELEGRLLETLLCDPRRSLRSHLAQSVAVATTMVRKHAPTNLVVDIKS